MQAPFRLRTDIARVIEGGHQFALGIEGGGWRPRCCGWARASVAMGENQPELFRYTVAVSHELIRPLMRELMRLLPSSVSGILELGSRDAFREIDVFLGAAIDRGEFLDAWELYETVLLEDASLGVGVCGTGGGEIFLDPDKRILVFVGLSAAPAMERVFRGFGLSECHEEDLDPMIRPSMLRIRSVLEEASGAMGSVDDLLLELRSVWRLELDEDPDHNLDGCGRDIGFTLWHGLVLVDQEDPAGRRYGHAHVWGVATSRRGMQHLIEAAIQIDMEWEFRETIHLDRVALDDRPSHLDSLTPPLKQEQCLSYGVDAIGTAGGLACDG